MKITPVTMIPRPYRTIKNDSATARQGQILVFFIFLTALALLFTTGFLSLQTVSYSQAKKIAKNREVRYLAEAGIDRGLNRFKANSGYTGETLSLGGATVTISITPGSTANERNISSSATLHGLTKGVRAKLVTQSDSVAVEFNYAMQVGSLGASIGNNSQIVGNLYSNQNITGGNGSQITGDAYAVGTISGITVTGQTRTGQPSQPLPALDSNFWRNRAQAGGTVNGDLTPATGSTIGPVYVTGNLTIGNQVSVTIRGPVYVAGTVTFGNGAIMVIDNSLGSSGVMIIAEQPIAIGNTLSVTSNGQGGYLLIVSLSSSSTAISIGNNAGNIQSPLYAPNGRISIGNSAQGVAFTGNGLTVGNGTIVTYDQGLADATFSGGPGGSWALQKGTIQEY